MEPNVNKKESAVPATEEGGAVMEKPEKLDFSYIEMKSMNKRAFSDHLDSLAKEPGNEMLGAPIVKKEAAKAVRKFMLEFFAEAKKISPEEAKNFVPDDRLIREISHSIGSSLARGPEGQIDLASSIKEGVASYYGSQTTNNDLKNKINPILSRHLEWADATAPLYKGQIMSRAKLFETVAKEIAQGKQVEDREGDLKKKKEKEEKEKKKQLEEAEQSISEGE
ncbi:MAG: hypothetical protein WC449_04235 [Candidatus Paceibacterota bacterium]